jgi:hypothetical protein
MELSCSPEDKPLKSLLIAFDCAALPKEHDGIQTHGVGYEKVTISYSATKEGWRTKPPREVRVTIQSSDGVACSDVAK